MVRGGGLEPPHHFWRQDLNLVRLPISPSSQLQFLKVIQHFTMSWTPRAYFRNKFGKFTDSSLDNRCIPFLNHRKKYPVGMD